MNPIIGTLVNGEINNKTKKNQNRVNFCSSFSFYVWLIGKTIISFENSVSQKKIWASKEKNVPQTQRQIFLLFPIFKKSARVGVIQLTLSMDIIQYLAYKKATKSGVTQIAQYPKITAINENESSQTYLMSKED